MATNKIDLITIKNDKLSLNIKGKPLHPDHQKEFPEAKRLDFSQADFLKNPRAVLNKIIDFFEDPKNYQGDHK